MGSRTLRSLVALAGTSVLVAGLAACGGSSSGSAGGGGGDGKTLHVLMGLNTAYPQEQQAWFASTADKFKKQTGATISWETFNSGAEEKKKIEGSVIAGSGPDVYGVGTTFTPTAYSTKVAVQLTDADWAKIGGKAKFVPSALGISGPDEAHQVGIPFVSRPFVMVYNTDMLKAAGFAKPATSWDELTAQAKKMTKGDEYGLVIAYKDNFDPWKFIWGMSYQAGNPIVDGKTVKLQDPTVKKAVQTYFGWVSTDKIVNPKAVGWTNAQALAEFAKGKTGFFPMTSAVAAKALENGAVKGHYAFALMPTTPPGTTTPPPANQQATSILSGDNLVVADYSKVKDLAFQFVKLITDKDAQLDYYNTFGQLPTNAEASAFLSTDPALINIEASLKGSKATPFTGAWADVQNALINVVVQSIPDLAGGVPDAKIDSRLADAQKTAQTALDRAK